MAGGSIDYSLGLATRSFLGPLGIAQGALAAFTTFAVGAGGIMAGVFAQIEKGGQLVDLRSRTGENIGALVQLQEGFKIVGLEASKVPQTVFQLQRALSGVSEGGESTADVISTLGLSFKDLRAQDTIGQLTTIAGRLAKLAPSDAAGLASKLFGRGASGDIIQLSRDLDGFQEALRESAPVAAAFQRFAGTFDEIGDRLGLLKTKASGFFVEIAGGLAPALLGLVNSLKGFDLQSFGKGIGTAFRAATAAFEKGQVTELVAVSLAAAFEKAVDVLERSLAAVFAATPDLINTTLGAALKGAALGLAGAFASNIAGILEGLAGIPGLGFSPVPGGGDTALGKALKDQAASLRLIGEVAKQEAPKAIQEAAVTFFGAARKGIAAFGVGQDGPAGERLKALVAELAGGDAPAGDGGKKGAGPPVLAFGGSRGGEADALTRIGFFSGSGNDANQSARITAKATQEMAKLLAKINEKMDPRPGGGFANQ